MRISSEAGDAIMTTPNSTVISPVPSGLLREMQQPNTVPHEMRVIKRLAFRVFSSPRACQEQGRAYFTPPVYIYQMSGPLLSRCEHYFEEGLLRIRYRMGFTESYVNVPNEDVYRFVSSDHNSRFLYDHIMPKYASTIRSIPFRPSVYTKPPGPDGESLRIVREHVSSAFRAYVVDLLSMKSISLRVVRSRKTKCGDHRRLASGKHLITVNEMENQLSFAFTLLHELAHAFAPRTDNSTAHDKYWKLIFGNMLVDCIQIFPKELTAYITELACNPSHSKDICEDYMFTKCGSDEFRGQSLANISFLRVRLELQRRFGIKLSHPESKSSAAPEDASLR